MFPGLLIGVVPREKSMGIHQALRIELPCDPSIPRLGICWMKTKAVIRKDIWTPVLTAALFIIGNKWEQPTWPSIGEWIKCKGFMYKMEYNQDKKRNRTISFVTRSMYGYEVITLSEISQM